MLHVPPSFFSFSFNNLNQSFAYPTSTVGDVIVAKTGSDLAGATWTQVASAAEVARDVYGIGLSMQMTRFGGENRSGVWALGIDKAGGTSYETIITDVLAATVLPGAQIASNFHIIPLFIPAGATIAIKAATKHSADITDAKCIFFCWGGASNPELVHRVTKSETLGYVGASVGTSITPGLRAFTGNIGVAAGDWHEVGTTTFPWTWAELSYACDTATITSETLWIEVGVGAGSTVTPLLQRIYKLLVNDETWLSMGIPHRGLLAPVPAGAKIYVRMMSGSTTTVNGSASNAVVTGFA